MLVWTRRNIYWNCSDIIRVMSRIKNSHLWYPVATFLYKYHYDPRVAIMPTLSSLVALETVVITTSDAHSHKKVVIMTILMFQCLQLNIHFKIHVCIAFDVYIFYPISNIISNNVRPLSTSEHFIITWYIFKMLKHVVWCYNVHKNCSNHCAEKALIRPLWCPWHCGYVFFKYHLYSRY